LPLLVSGVLADHVYLAPATDDLASLADPFHARSNLHRPLARFRVDVLRIDGKTRLRCRGLSSA